MTVKQRLTRYIKSKGISTREFCRMIGVSETYVNSMRSSIQPDKLIRITHAFPDMNPEWLLTGDGEMLKESPTLPPVDRNTFIEAASDIFKDKLLELFKQGEIFAAPIVWEQHRLIMENAGKIKNLEIEVEKLKAELKKCKDEHKI